MVAWHNDSIACQPVFVQTTVPPTVTSSFSWNAQTTGQAACKQSFAMDEPEAAPVLDELDPAAIIARFSWRPDFIVNCGITVRELISRVTPKVYLTRSSIGALDNLPAEILLQILNYSDARSLSRLRCVSRAGQHATESLRAFREVVALAPQVLIALSKTGIIQFHSIASIYATLFTQTCVYCSNYPPYLFLPTCERCCYRCLQQDRRLLLISSNQARQYLNISQSDLKRIPIMLSLPGKYYVGTYITRARRIRLVSWGQAIELGQSLQGTTELNSLTYKCPIFPPEQFRGMGSVFVPTLRLNQTPEFGLWCFGCRYNDFVPDYEARSGIQSSPSTFSPYRDRYLHNSSRLTLERQGRSAAEFIKHGRTCSGVRKMLENGRQPDIC